MTQTGALDLPGDAKTCHTGEITLSLGYRPPYAWNSLLSFLAARAIPGVESVDEDAYRRTVSIRKGATLHCGWISVLNLSEQNALSISMAPTLLPVLSQALAAISHLFDINCSPGKFTRNLRP